MAIKIHLMAKLTTQQEVILVQGTGFTNRQYCEKTPPSNNNYLSQNEKLKQACWNGMLKDMMPELFFMFTPDVKLYLWQMRECEKLLTLEMSEEPTELDYYASIDPYCFMEIQEYN
jgi:hypothetical protein